VSESLLEFLQRTQAECGGAIPAERAMREALYHPEHGYYARNIRTVGRRGDFATSASLGEALGSGIARWLWKNRIRHRGKWHVIEAGAGSGELARTVLRRLGPWRRLGLHYHIVETSPVLRAEQQRALPQFRVHWHDSMNAALAACDGCALVFSNELLDAFPCRVLERRDGRWLELGIRVEGGYVSECLIECDADKTVAAPLCRGENWGARRQSKRSVDSLRVAQPERQPPGWQSAVTTEFLAPQDCPPLASSALEIDAAEGQRVEVNVAAAEWLASWAHAAREVIMLTIDYGDEVPALYRRRACGTLRAYFHHQRFEGLEVWHRFGRQDITADVNFTDLRAWTERLGWRTRALETQAEFLAAHGAIHAGLHDAQLADHTGAGAAFKVLVSEKLMAPEPPVPERRGPEDLAPPSGDPPTAPRKLS
jgi:SAM-dependent MidA family methyltransferase